MLCVTKKSALAWKIVNEVSGRKNSNKAKLKVNIGKKKRIRLWNDHFKELLGVIIVCCSNYNGIDLDAKNG